MSESSPPPVLLNMQRLRAASQLSLRWKFPDSMHPAFNLGPPGYHPWLKLDQYNRLQYGGNPSILRVPAAAENSMEMGVTSDGKTVAKADWGVPTGYLADEELEEEESSDEEMDESEEEAEEGEEGANDGASLSFLLLSVDRTHGSASNPETRLLASGRPAAVSGH
jgi:hypothetical protein